MKLDQRADDLGGLLPARGEQFAPLSEREVAEIEQIIQAPIPQELADVLRKYGGIAFGGYVTVHSKQPLSDRVASASGLPFSHTFGSPALGNALSLARVAGVLRNRMPFSVMPFAGDGGGNVYCIGTAGTARGRIYYWDHNDEWDADDYLEDIGVPMPESEKFRNLHLVAENFDAFLDCLKAED